MLSSHKIWIETFFFGRIKYISLETKAFQCGKYVYWYNVIWDIYTSIHTHTCQGRPGVYRKSIWNWIMHTIMHKIDSFNQCFWIVNKMHIRHQIKLVYNGKRDFNKCRTKHVKPYDYSASDCDRFFSFYFSFLKWISSLFCLFSLSIWSVWQTNNYFIWAYDRKT